MAPDPTLYGALAFLEMRLHFDAGNVRGLLKGLARDTVRAQIGMIHYVDPLQAFTDLPLNVSVELVCHVT